MQLARLFARKPLSALERDADDVGSDAGEEGGHLGLKRSLTALDLMALGIGAIIGAGIFTATGAAVAGTARLGHADGAGPALILSYVFTAVACGFAALCYAEFAAMIPKSGSAYTYAYVSFGEIPAWIIGWDLVLEYAVGNIAVAVSWSAFFQQLLSGLGVRLPAWLGGAVTAETPRLFGHPVTVNVPAFLIVMLLTVLLVIGVKESARFNRIIVGLKLLVVLGFVVVGARYVRPEHFHPFAPNGFSGVMTGAAAVFFSYIGFDAVSTVAEETKNPQRDMPVGMIGSLLVCTVIYIVVTLVLTGMLPWRELGSEDALATALAKNGVNWAAGVLSFGAVIALTAVLLVFQLGQPRILFAMARDGLLPSWFTRVHPRYRTPANATVATGLFVGVPAAFLDFNDALGLCNIGTLFAFLLVSAGVLVLRRAEPDRPRPFRCPAVPAVPALSILCCLGLTYYLPAMAKVGFVAWLLVGLVLYGLYGFRHSRLRS